MYPGGKGNLYQQIINRIPPHDVYIETHLGGGAIMKRKRPARINIGIDLDAAVLEQTARTISSRPAIYDDAAGKPHNMATILSSKVTSYFFLWGDALNWLSGFPWQGNEFVYVDPPYVLSSRSSARPIYTYEYDDQDHVRLLDALKQVPANVMISGYESELYNRLLPGWTTTRFMAMTRGGTMAEEWLWMNYREPEQLHDYQYLGADYRERERIKRKKDRWVAKLAGLPRLERQAILWAMEEAGYLPGRTGSNGDTAGHTTKSNGAAAPTKTTMQAGTGINSGASSSYGDCK